MHAGITDIWCSIKLACKPRPVRTAHRKVQHSESVPSIPKITFEEMRNEENVGDALHQAELQYW